MKLKEDINKIIQSTFSEYNIATKQCPNPLIFALIRQNKNHLRILQHNDF